MTYKGKSPEEHEMSAAEGYDAYASAYVHDEKKLDRFDLKMLMRALRLLTGLSVLDLGCGTGRLAPLFQKRLADHVVGCDLAPGMLEVAAKTGAYRELVQGDLLEELPFDWESFDVVICSMVLVHIPQKMIPHAMQEMFRITKPGGFVYVVNLPQRRAPKLYLPDGRTIFIESYIHADNKIIAALEEAGFSDVMIDEHKEGADHYATLIRVQRPL
ncbi:hypothetical protein COW46_03105 [Candidatus Gracilibacteria bacterium CG17_big_fil_post_rev_8_21_14_2_50_48_13]|nr:MAG: hypothetical protein COW46_03105 [Candidatus Gracilibacteria bacterium CG17_big_fil_post_rev_8_21_14_2_50_48_13]